METTASKGQKLQFFNIIELINGDAAPAFLSAKGLMPPHAESMFTLVDRCFVAPLDRAIDICYAAIKARKPQGRNETEQRHALLYDHAINFDGSNEEKGAILAAALLAVPAPDSFKSEVIRFPKTKFGEGGELHEVTDAHASQTEAEPAVHLPFTG